MAQTLVGGGPAQSNQKQISSGQPAGVDNFVVLGPAGSSNFVVWLATLMSTTTGHFRRQAHSTVTLFARFRGLSTSVPRAQAV